MTKKNFTFERIFEILYLLTIFSTIAVLTFSVSFHIEKIIFCLMLVSFFFVFVPKYKSYSSEMKARFYNVFHSIRFIYIVFTAYLIWDIYILFYTKDISLAFGKFPQYAEYLLLFPIGVYFCSSRKRIKSLILTVASVGSFVSAGAYIIYFFTRRPIYFQRLSTAPDYNVFSTVVFISLLFTVVFLMNEKCISFKKRLVILIGLLVLNMPVLYLSGSRRMMIMLPYFFIFSVIFESVRFCHFKNPDILCFWRRMIILVLCGVFYITSSYLTVPFASYGSKKEYEWNKYQAQQQQLSSQKAQKKLSSHKETTIENVINSISSGTMANRRKLIYSVAFQELSKYSVSDLLIGKGAAYDIYLFDHTKDKALLQAYDYDEMHPPYSGWMCAHNFAIADVMNGGIIKLILSLTLIGGMFSGIIAVVQRNSEYGILLIVSFALVVSNNFISGAYGFLNDIFFSIILTLICAIRIQQSKDESERRNVYEQD